MLVGIGTDIVEVARMAKAVDSQHFQQRVFTAREVEYCQSRGKQAAQSFAARFAA
ncbi:MAG: 4'-phosphopantetheinyl transferase superfamily protein, partial [Selenomonas sp.]|nr:4'-phosphopantetheinyl transferase superfamily protein [Selenomonas sp.]